MDSHEARGIAERIAFGHAFQKHVVERNEFPEFATPADFAQAIERALAKPSVTRSLMRQRIAYWSDEERLLVIVDFISTDLGTAYRSIVGAKEIEFLV